MFGVPDRSKPVEAWLEAGLDPHGSAPLYRQLHERLRQAIADGTLPAGTRLPSSRVLSESLSVSRATVQTAYDMLGGEGLVHGRGAAGTVVAAHSAGASSTPSARQVQNPSEASSRPSRLRLGIPALDAFPYKSWSRLLAHRARDSAQWADQSLPTVGSARLRASVVQYLALTRGIACRAEQVIITSGYQGALGLITRLLIKPGDAVWVENPGYPRAREALRLAGARLVAVPVDKDGIIVTAGEASARMAVVTPSHEAPLGMALSLDRRLALLKWAGLSDAWIVEDDYYSEFRDADRPIPALKSLDADDRVIYAGTFSKAMHPSLRLGYMVAPRRLAPSFAHAAEYLASGQALLLQEVMADFMDQGFFARHVKRMRQLYAERREAMMSAFMNEPLPWIDVTPQTGGMHLVARLPPGTDDRAMARRASAAGYDLQALSDWHVDGDGPVMPGLLLSFANLPVSQAGVEVARLVVAIGGSGSSALGGSSAGRR